MPLPDVISIASGPFSARICPAWGGRMTHLTHAQFGDILMPTETDVFDPWNWPKAGAYPLFPYHNRLYGASFVHGGVAYNVLPNPALGKDATHGPAHRRPWHLASQTSDKAVLALAYEADDEWPFAFEAQQSFTLTAQGLTVQLTLTNKAEVPAPAAIGWHPYFAAGLDREAQTDAALAYPLDDHDLPTGEPPVARSTKFLPALAGYTKHFAQWSHAKIILKDSRSLVIEADPVLSHLAAHRTERYICLEPVSMAAGTLYQPEVQRGDLGLKIQAPGESLIGSMRLSL
ncbi:aldose 1-epimerase [Agrobacterium rosae]|uniref:Aldose 1-epimerase n=1 Tax=Agrobacterium rosae TaxID=1972867 RepID=A0AAW9FJP5_9HYPH|nr:aldose 1-epimerase [Agrobacterium rosae]MDX8305356.1 aldose 1-epimerase [Agrobacterium rosae]MDX8312152.1 aldose 1-epimerase [Agrobacterium rosae]